MHKEYMTFAVVTLLTSPALAGGYSAPITEAPPVMRAVQAKSTPSWSGPYGGLTYGLQKVRRQREFSREIPIIENRQETRDANKVDVWRENTENGCNDPNEEFMFTRGPASYVTTCQNLISNTPDDGWAEWSAHGHDPIVIREWQETVGHEQETFTESSWDKNSTAGVFVGYRHHLQSNLVLGTEFNYSRSAGEDSTRLTGQVAYAIDRVLPYVSIGYDFSSEEAVYGVGLDVAITDRVIGGLAYTQESSGDLYRVEARIGWKF